jgi:hypothetical protein
VFRDEMLNLFPENSDAVHLSRQTLLLSEFRFSCREQIAQGAKRHTFRLAEILDLAFKVIAQDHRVYPRTTTSRGLTHVFNVINEESRLLQQRRCHRSFTAA